MPLLDYLHPSIPNGSFRRSSHRLRVPCFSQGEARISRVSDLRSYRASRARYRLLQGERYGYSYFLSPTQAAHYSGGHLRLSGMSTRDVPLERSTWLTDPSFSPSSAIRRARSPCSRATACVPPACTERVRCFDGSPAGLARETPRLRSPRCSRHSRVWTRS